MTKTSNIIDKVENNIIHTYNRYQIALDKGEGMYLYDAEGKKYLDFGSGIGVFALGYGNTEALKAVKQVEVTPDMQVEELLKRALKFMF